MNLAEIDISTKFVFFQKLKPIASAPCLEGLIESSIYWQIDSKDSWK